MLLAKCDCGNSFEYFDLVEASSMIHIHSESLRRLYRDSAPDDYGRQGIRIVSTLFFTAENLKALGYPVTTEDTNHYRTENSAKIKLYPKEGADDATE